MKVRVDLGEHVGTETCIATTLEEGCCDWLRSEKFGQRWWCSLYNAHLNEGVTTRLRRLPICIESTIRRRRKNND